MRSAILPALGLILSNCAAQAQTAGAPPHAGTLGVFLGNLPLTNSQNLVAGQLWDQGVRASQQAIGPNTQSYAISNAHATMRTTSNSSTTSTTNMSRRTDGRSGTGSVTHSGQNDFYIWGNTRFDTITKNGIGSAWGRNSGNVASSATLNNGGSTGSVSSTTSAGSSSSSNATAIAGGGLRR
ncbi:hypothetical protein [Microvirga sp. TS319]|uniref:hypothetical protein n=1 Tax=Microvirga sp. TS319 TaxID=3241165 RepID=UPI003519EEC7